MKKRIISMALSLLLLLTLVPSTAVFSEENIVSPGIDTLAQAVKAAHRGDTLLLSDGVYYVTSTLYINKSLTIRAADGANPTITGSRPLTGWEKVDDNIYRAPYSPTTMPMLIENGQTAVIARFPNKPEKANFSDGYIFATGASYSVGGQTGTLEFDEAIPDGISSDSLQLVGWGDRGSNYANTVLDVSSISDNSVTYSGVMHYNVSVGTRFYIRGDKALIDVPGEYALYGGYLYYYPYNAANLETGISASSTFGEVIQVSASNVVFSDIAFKGTALGTFKTDVLAESSVYFKNDNPVIKIVGNHVSIDNCLFDGIGSSAIVTTGNYTAVQNSKFQNIGAHAILLDSSNNTVLNNEITKTGMESGGGAAVNISGHYNLVAHNEIYDHPRWAINAYGNLKGNIIEYNDLYNCNTDSSDTGLIYFDHVYNEESNIIRYNHVHDSCIYGGMGFGIYLDDDCGYVKVYGNLVDHLYYANEGWVAAPIMVKGTANEVYNNIVADNRNLVPDEKGSETYQKNFDKWNTSGNITVQLLHAGYTTVNNILHHNVIYENDNPSLYCVMMSDARVGIEYCDNNVYYVNEHDYAPIFNANCTYYICATISYTAFNNPNSGWYEHGFDSHSVAADPGFVDGLNRNFNLRDDSILYDMGFEPLPLDEMGMTGNREPLPEPDPSEEDPDDPSTEPTITIPDATPLWVMDRYIDGHGQSDETVSFEDGTLTLTKAIKGAFRGYVPVNENVGQITSDTVYTLLFNAEISGGYNDNWYDGYRLCFKNHQYSDYGYGVFMRIMPLSGQMTGLCHGIGQAEYSTDGGIHQYMVVFNSEKAEVYCNGKLALVTENLNFNGDLIGIGFSESQDDASGCELSISYMAIYEGDLMHPPVPTMAMENSVYENNTFSADVKISNVSEADLWIAAFDAQNKLIAVDKKPLSQASDTHISLNGTDIDKVKTFLFKKATIIPILPSEVWKK